MHTLRSYRFAPGEGDSVGTSYAHTGELDKFQVTLTKKGSEFDIGPYLSVNP
jgi:hypothetical protein